MGVAGLRDAFNSIAAPRYAATLAFLSTERADGAEWSILRFSGIGSDGSAFEVASSRIPAGADVTEAAKATALKLIEGAPGAPVQEPPP